MKGEVMDMDNLSEGLKKVMLAGIGAMALTAEKSQKFIEDMVEKGEITVEQGKALNKELKHTMDEKKKEKEEGKTDKDVDIADFVSKLSPEQLQELKEQLGNEK